MGESKIMGYVAHGRMQTVFGKFVKYVGVSSYLKVLEENKKLVEQNDALRSDYDRLESSIKLVCSLCEHRPLKDGGE